MSEPGLIVFDDQDLFCFWAMSENMTNDQQQRRRRQSEQEGISRKQTREESSAVKRVCNSPSLSVPTGFYGLFIYFNKNFKHFLLQNKLRVF